MRGDRDIKEQSRHNGDSIVRTMAMSFIIASLIIFAAMAYPLIKNAPQGAEVTYYLPWMLPYGIVNLLIAIYGVYLTVNGREHPEHFFLYSCIGLVPSILLFFEGIPIFFLGNIEMAISSMVIGACAIVISSLAVATCKKKP